MKLAFIVFDPIFSDAFGYLARFKEELKYIKKDHDVTIINLGQKEDSEQIKKNNSEINFLHFKTKFNGWNVVNSKDVINFLFKNSQKYKYDLIILQMETWDLIREMHKNKEKLPPFATVMHAMPFLIAPTHPTGNFINDVNNCINSNIEEYKKEYIRDHYNEIFNIIYDINIIANNNTVNYYLDSYFSNLNKWKMSRSILTDKRYPKKDSKITYDFVYMASMIPGKGTKYLLTIIKNISFLLKRPISLVVLGRTYDIESIEDILKLQSTANKSDKINVFNLGFADENKKKEIFSKSGVFIYPSHCDNYPTVINEALINSLPCVTWDLPYYKLNYSKTKAVCGVPFQNYKKFAESSIKMLNEREKYSKYALRFVNSFNTIKDNANNNLKIYNEIIKYERNK